MNKENIIDIEIFERDFDAYVSRIEKGESFIVTRNSLPIFKVIPVK